MNFAALINFIDLYSFVLFASLCNYSNKSVFVAVLLMADHPLSILCITSPVNIVSGSVTSGLVWRRNLQLSVFLLLMFKGLTGKYVQDEQVFTACTC